VRVTDGEERGWREGAGAEERGGRDVPTVIGEGEAARRRERAREEERGRDRRGKEPTRRRRV
jgi:hypothetical protein